MPHLDSFRRTARALIFRIRRDDEYWDTVRTIQTVFGRAATYAQDTKEFTVPFNTRSQIRLSIIFQEEWKIIQDTNAKAIDFGQEEGHAHAP